MFLKGFLLGFSIAAPVGPIGFLCLQRTLNRGWRAGFVSGLGAATADGFYGLIAAGGISAVVRPLLGFQFWLQLGGAGYLAWLGVQTFRRAAVSPTPIGSAAGGLGVAFGSVFLLTMANPATILSFLAVFAGLGAPAADAASALDLVAGVFLGSATWWLVLSFLAGSLRGRLDGRSLRWINRLAGVCLIALAVWTVTRVHPV
jgi:threonine/homoserine/homoserine lactone efflux protein